MRKYVRLAVTDFHSFDESLAEADSTYKTRMHNLCCDNCHSHVACALNYSKYLGKTDWTMVSIFFLLCTKSRYVSWTALVLTYAPFLVMTTVIVVLVLLA